MKIHTLNLNFYNKCRWLPVLIAIGIQISLHGQTPCVQLRFSTVTANTGDTVTMRLTGQGFTNITSYQFATRWNPADLQFLQYSTAGSGLTYQLFNGMQAGQGKLISIWSDINATGVTLPDDDLLFEIKFKVLAAGSGFYPVWINPEDAPVFELVQDVNVMPFTHIIGGVQVSMSSDLKIESCCSISPPCNAALGAVNILTSGGIEPFQYHWSGPGGFSSSDSELKNVLPGLYKVTVTDADGTEVVASAIVLPSYTSVQVAALNTKHAICSQPNGCAELTVYNGTPPFTFQWSVAGPAIEDRCDLAPGYHYVTVTDAVGCTGSTYVNIANDSLLSITLDSVNADCRFSQLGAAHVTTSGTAPYICQWSNGATGTDIANLTAGEYSVTVSDAAGCDAKGSVTVRDYGTFDWFTNISKYCATATKPSRLRLTGYDFAHRAAFPITIVWSNGTIQEVKSVDDNVVSPVLSELSDLSPGHYTVTVTDTDGCSVQTGANLDCVVHEPVSNPGTRFYIKGHQWGTLDSCATISADHFSGIKELGFSLRWHPSWMELKNIKNPNLIMGISMSNFTVSSPGWIDFHWISPSPQGYSYPFEFPLFDVCFKNHSWDTPLLDFAYSDEPPKVVHATEGEKGFIGKNGRVFFAYGSNSELVQDFNLSPPSCAWDGYARVQLESYDNQVVDPYKSLQFEKAYSYYPQVDADTLLFAPPGTFHFRTSGMNDKMSRFLVHIPPYDLPAYECVWPGDADNNGVVNHFDLLYMGLGIGTSGISRAYPDSIWAGSDCADWPEQTPLRHINFKNFDADGNGTIEASDTSVIMMHWGRSIHPYKSDFFAMPGAPDNFSDQISISLSADTLPGGQEVEIPVMLDMPAGQGAGLHGLAFSISYDADLLLSGMQFIPTTSWLGDPAADLIAIQKDFRGQRRLDVALTRTGGPGASGSGQIGKLILIFKAPPPGSIVKTPLFVSHVLAITPGEERIALKDIRADVRIGEKQSVQVSSVPALESSIQLAPNPASGYIRIDSPLAEIRRVEISNAAGKTILAEEPGDNTRYLNISVDHLPASPFVARIYTKNGVVLKKFVIAR